MAILLHTDWLALPGIPAGAAVWEKLPVRVLSFTGLQDAAPRASWELDSFVEEILPAYNHQTILMGHDLGGVVASMAALRKAPKAVVLSGTALGSWWFWTRLSAAPILNRLFYHTFKGGLFVRLGGGRTTQQRFSANPHAHNPENMKRLARKMKPPKDLVPQLAARCPVFLIWGEQEVFYPGFLATSLAKAFTTKVLWSSGGHYCMWTQPQAFLENMLHIEQQLADIDALSCSKSLSNRNHNRTQSSQS